MHILKSHSVTIYWIFYKFIFVWLHVRIYICYGYCAIFHLLSFCKWPMVYHSPCCQWLEVGSTFEMRAPHGIEDGMWFLIPLQELSSVCPLSVHSVSVNILCHKLSIFTRHSGLCSDWQDFQVAFLQQSSLSPNILSSHKQRR